MNIVSRQFQSIFYAWLNVCAQVDHRGHHVHLPTQTVKIELFWNRSYDLGRKRKYSPKWCQWGTIYCRSFKKILIAPSMQPPSSQFQSCYSRGIQSNLAISNLHTNLMVVTRVRHQPRQSGSAIGMYGPHQYIFIHVWIPNLQPYTGADSLHVRFFSLDNPYM